MFILAIMVIATFLGYYGFGLHQNTVVNRCLSSGGSIAECDCVGQELRVEVGMVRSTLMWSDPLATIINFDREAAITQAEPVARARCRGETT